MTIDEIKKWMLESSGFPVTQANAEYLERFQAIAFQAGSASRDAYIEQLELALLQVRKAICGDIHNTDDLLDLIASRDAEIQHLKMALADTEALELGTAEKCDQLRSHINVLRDALDAAATSLETIQLRSYGDESYLNHMDQVRGFAGSRARVAKESIASTPEQSLAEYRNKVIEDCAVKADALANCEENTDGYRNGAAWCAEAIRAMKEQPLLNSKSTVSTRLGA